MKAYPGNITPQDFDHYVFLQPEQFRSSLVRLREIILSVVPQAEETISYQIPCFKYLYLLVGVGTNKKFCSFYTMNPALVKEMAGELQRVRVSGATIHLKPDEPLPVELLIKIVKARMVQNEQIALTKRNK
ncbi:iron chaperone [Mucilaginibacter glaciei]|uniref:DUF1801 domain-containing protein n=1 Tax=Mucilaginibacter glaciei TaxID=2772109 RepID=A0A926NU15_9SPHI|nr:DUF1801 domain-containing protein [Mucilaginibacter glaciei]MBD1391768.1 DUF1801 domain-containing protein [Mucilaginibacter glaciei]